MKKATLREQVRSISKMGEVDAFREFGELRRSVSPGAYSRLYKELQIVAPRYRGMVGTKKPVYEDLVRRGPLRPLDLGSEIRWASAHIRENCAELNSYLRSRNDVHASFLRDDLNSMLTTVEGVIERHGWSLWAVNIIFSLKHKNGGMSEVRSFAAELRAKSIGKVGALYATVLVDRVDDSFSYNSFRAKIRRSAENFTPEWFRKFISFKAASVMEDPQNDYPIILASEIPSSVIDYYEAVIECISDVVQMDALKEYREPAKELLLALKADSLEDWRIEKLLRIVGCQHIEGELVSSGEEFLVSALYLHSELDGTENSFGVFTSRIASIARARVGSSDFDGLIKLGVNFKGVPAGLALAHRAIMALNVDDDDPLVDVGFAIGTRSRLIEEYLCHQDDDVIALLRDLLIRGGIGGRTQSVVQWILRSIDLGLEDDEVHRSIYTIWLARYMCRTGRYLEAIRICDSMMELGQEWNLFAEKIKIRCLVEQDDLRGAIEIAAEVLIKDYKYAYDLPLAKIFSGRRWSDFSGVDIYSLGIVSHYANSTTQDGNARFICRMSCREIYKKNEKAKLESEWDSLSIPRQALVIAFFEDVWVDENLALVDDLKSSHQVRNNRISVIQSLLLWNPDEESSYSEYIKQLTLDETLWMGLRYLDENRIFVNESAISRWAEKELIVPFERWKAVVNEGGGSRLHDEVLRSYLISSSVEEMAESMPDVIANESHVMLVEAIQRLQERFMTDPADGLESYLSLRIRHGTLKGTLLGVLEQEDLLISGSYSEASFARRWMAVVELSSSPSCAVDALKDFSRKIQDVVKRLVDEYIQVASKSKPLGVFKVGVDLSFARVLVSSFESGTSFSDFIYTCYVTFWQALKPARVEMAQLICGKIKGEIQYLFEALYECLGEPALAPLLFALKVAATKIQNQADVVASWFTNESMSGDQSYPLGVVIEIASRATKNIYGNFPGEVAVEHSEGAEVSLTSAGLAVIYDCLFVIFENAWKHSGLSSSLGEIVVSTSFDPVESLLEIRVSSRLSKCRIGELEAGGLEAIRQRYLTSVAADFVSKEGGSGLAKLARAVRMAKRPDGCSPLSVAVKNGCWVVSISIPLYERAGVYDAFV